MKLTRQLLSIGFALFVSTVLASAIPGRAEVKKVVGQATVAKASGGSASVTAGMVLGAGDTVTTGRASTVDLDLGINGDFVRVEPDTSLKISVLDIANVANRTVNTEFVLAGGSVVGNVVNKLSAASKYEIKTATGVAGIRGTKYRVMSLNGKVSEIVVTSGIVTFIDRGVTITIDATQGAKKYVPPPQAPANAQAAAALVGKANANDTKAVNDAAASIQSFSIPNGGTLTTTVVADNPLTTSSKVTNP